MRRFTNIGFYKVGIVLTFCICAFFTESIFTQSSPAPSGHSDYAVRAIEAVDADTSHGDRRSTTTLKMVTTGLRAATLNVISHTGTKDSNEPIWSGFQGDSNYTGAEQAQWKDTKSGTATANGSKGSASVAVELVPLNEQKISIGGEHTGEKEFKTQTSNYMTGYGKTPTWSAKGEISGTLRNVDYYGDGNKVGIKATLGGEVSFGFAEIEIPFLPIPALAGAVTVTPKAGFKKFTITLKLKCVYDESLKDPWAEKLTGSLEGSSGISGGLDVGVGIPKYAEVVGEFRAGSEITAGADVTTDGKKKIILKKFYLKIGVLKGSVAVKGKLAGSLEWEAWKKETTLPSDDAKPFLWEGPEEVPLYTIPDSLKQ